MQSSKGVVELWHSCPFIMRDAGCTSLLSAVGSQSLHQDGPTSTSRKVFVIGGLKTGTTSMSAALSSVLKLPPCKWGVALTDLGKIAHFAASPVAGSSQWHQRLQACTILADNPWWLLAPKLLASFPNSSFILTRWSGGCKAWLEHFEGLYRWGVSDLRRSGWIKSGALAWHACIFNATNLTTATRSSFLSRCEVHEHATMRTARLFHRPLLVWDTDAPRSDGERWETLRNFMSLNFDMSGVPHVSELGPWPHVQTPGRISATVGLAKPPPPPMRQSRSSPYQELIEAMRPGSAALNQYICAVYGVGRRSTPSVGWQWSEINWQWAEIDVIWLDKLPREVAARRKWAEADRSVDRASQAPQLRTWRTAGRWEWPVPARTLWVDRLAQTQTQTQTQTQALWIDRSVGRLGSSTRRADCGAPDAGAVSSECRSNAGGERRVVSIDGPRVSSPSALTLRQDAGPINGRWMEVTHMPAVAPVEAKSAHRADYAFVAANRQLEELATWMYAARGSGLWFWSGRLLILNDLIDLTRLLGVRLADTARHVVDYDPSVALLPNVTKEEAVRLAVRRLPTILGGVDTVLFERHLDKGLDYYKSELFTILPVRPMAHNTHVRNAAVGASAREAIEPD